MSYLTVKEAAVILRVSANTIYAMVAVGKLPATRVDVGRGKILIPRTAVEDRPMDEKAVTINVMPKQVRKINLTFRLLPMTLL